MKYAGDLPRQRYPWKEIPGSSHDILLSRIAARGEGLAVLDVGFGAGPLARRIRPRCRDRAGSELDPPAAREGCADTMKEHALAWAVGIASSTEIDRLGIVPATRLAARRALDDLDCGIEHILIDYLILPDLNFPQTPLVKGDARSLSIAAASVLAKTARDAQMVEMDALYPGYFLASNKGYATSAHREAVTKLGPCAEHRCSFSPVAEFYGLFPPKKGE